MFNDDLYSSKQDHTGGPYPSSPVLTTPQISRLRRDLFDFLVRNRHICPHYPSSCCLTFLASVCIPLSHNVSNTSFPVNGCDTIDSDCLSVKGPTSYLAFKD